jgi:UDPglucose--hexose-1-phosphate uridylyltransferase
LRDDKNSKDAPGWQVRVVPSISPLLRIEGKLNRRGEGIFDTMDAIGAHEIIIETPQHIAKISDLPLPQIRKVIRTYISRIIDLRKDKRFKYVMLFKNYGWEAGGSKLKHSRSQLIATPVTPKRVKEELAEAKTYYNYRDRCLFCDIISQELQTGSRVVLESEHMLVIVPFAARFPFEMWILPKKHSCCFVHTEPNQWDDLAFALKDVLTRLDKVVGDTPYNYILHTAPFQREQKARYWKTINEDYHWHIEIMPRLTRVAGFEWGSGFYINPTPPEEAAKFLREVEI